MNSNTSKSISLALCAVVALLWAKPIHQTLIYHNITPTFHAKVDNTAALLVAKISKRYTAVPDEVLADVVKYTAKYAHKDFPKQQDLIAVIAIESSFNPKAVSNLKRDPAIGLTQIRPHAWRHKIKRDELDTIENQIKYGSEILAHNYKRVGNKKVALHAYNLGLTAALRGKRSATYVVKYERELNYLKEV